MSLAKTVNLLKRKNSFLISTHVSPDPDALCSELALALCLKAQGKKVFVINEEGIPERFAFFPGARLIRSAEHLKSIAYDAAIVVDCGDLDRIGDVRRVINARKPILNIDHHVTNDSFGSINFLRRGASSTAEMIFDLLSALKYRLTKDVAILLYLGIMTDTGSFRYDNTTARTHEVISHLMHFDIPVSDLYRRLYERVPYTDIKMFMKVVGSLALDLGGRVVWVELPKKLVSKFSEDFDLREKIFTFLRSITGVEVIVILTEQSGKKTRINFRSQGKVNVAKLAARFQGGGHKKASGCILDYPIKKAKQKILHELEIAL